MIMKRISSLFCATAGCIFIHQPVAAESYAGYKSETASASEINDSADDELLWNTKPEETNSVNIQILDKISGKVFRERIKVNQPIQFESLKICLKKCFKSSPDDSNEVYAYVIIQDGERVRFSGWLYASAPAVNLFEHSVYDVRVEF